MAHARSAVQACLLVSAAALSVGCAQRQATRDLQLAGTDAAITESDLRLRLSDFAHDSMMGRAAGKRGNYMATEYLSRALLKIGLEPGGEAGSWFQEVPMLEIGPDAAASVRIGDEALAEGIEFLLIPRVGGFQGGERVSGDDVEAVYAGLLSSPAELDEAAVRGRVVVLGAPTAPSPLPFDKYPSAAALVVPVLQNLPPQAVQFYRAAHTVVADAYTPAAGPLGILVMADGVRRIFGAPAEALQPGAIGNRRLTLHAGFTAQPVAAPARNVIAILRGTDARLNGQYVAMGAHSDHVGMMDHPVDGDSVRAFNRVMRPQGLQTPVAEPDASQRAAIQRLYEQYRGGGPLRLDSIFNGADDDGSGSVALLEIAEALAHGPSRPRRSILFVWHTAEELGMLGSGYFTDHPTVPLDSVVAQINIDMIGRGMEQDLPGGGPAYLELIGSRRLATELGDVVEAVNQRAGHGFIFDYTLDAPGHPQNIYCRSDHAKYARFGIPVAFFTTGVHPEYHQLTDEVEFIDFTKMRRVSELVRDVALEVANRQEPIRVDQPVPDPAAPCRQ